MSSLPSRPGTSVRALLVLIAVLIGIIAGLVWGILAVAGGAHIAAAFGGGGAAFAGAVTLVLLIESSLGLL